MKQPEFHLVTHMLCPYVQRSIIILEEKNIPYIRTDIDLANKPSWFEKKSPLGKVPILLIEDKHTLFESAVICEYLDEATPGTLHPVDILEKAYHRAWIEFGSEILNNIASLYNAKERSQFHAIENEIGIKFRMLERELNCSPFFSGEKFHLIDCVYAPIFRYFDIFDSFVKLNTFDDLPKCQLWRSALNQRSSIRKAVIEDYSNRLKDFLINRKSHISRLVQSEINI